MSPITKIALRRIKKNSRKSIFLTVAVLFSMLMISFFIFFELQTILWFASIGSLVATTLVCEVPFLANAFGFASVGIVEYLIAIGLGLVVIPVVEIVKLIQRAIHKKKN